MGKHMEKPARKRRWLPWLIVLCVLLSVCLVMLGIVWSFMNKIQRPDDTAVSYMDEEQYNSMVQAEEDPVPSDAEVLDPDSVSWGEEEKIELEDDVTNILLIGQDRRPGEGRGRSDSIILCSLNKTTNKISMVSFLRDLYVQIPGYQDNRINAAYAFGGPELLDETIELNFGIEIDANVEVDFNAFEAVIDSLGGVDITLTDAEYDYFQECNQTYAVPGLNHFNGEQALFYARIRYLDSDFGRTGRQRNVLTSVFNRFRGASLGEMIDLANTLLPTLTVDLSNTQILGYLADFYPMLGGCELDTMGIPTGDTFRYASIREMSVVVPDLPACREILREHLNSH